MRCAMHSIRINLEYSTTEQDRASTDDGRKMLENADELQQSGYELPVESGSDSGYFFAARPARASRFVPLVSFSTSEGL